MRTVVLGGTAWLGRTIAEAARDLGHDVTCVARGRAGSTPRGVTFVRADRSRPGAYRGVHGDVDLVLDVSSHPGHVRQAAAAFAGRAGRYVFVSTGNVYADHSVIGQIEDAPLLPALDADEMTSAEHYGQAKVACEQAVAQAFPDGHVLARAGLIAGPGDTSGRTAYWPWRFAHPSNPEGRVLVPQTDGLIQLIDVRDLADWLVTTDAVGAGNLVGEPLPLAEYLKLVRTAVGHTGPLSAVTPSWLADHEVAQWMGHRSLPLWLSLPGWEGFAARSNARAVAAGLRLRPLADTVHDTLAWTHTHPPPWKAGLSDDDERDLLTRWASRTEDG